MENLRTTLSAHITVCYAIRAGVAAPVVTPPGAATSPPACLPLWSEHLPYTALLLLDIPHKNLPAPRRGSWPAAGSWPLCGSAAAAALGSAPRAPPPARRTPPRSCSAGPGGQGSLQFHLRALHSRCCCCAVLLFARRHQGSTATAGGNQTAGTICALTHVRLSTALLAKPARRKPKGMAPSCCGCCSGIVTKAAHPAACVTAAISRGTSLRSGWAQCCLSLCTLCSNH